jgi:hypothetical protein
MRRRCEDEDAKKVKRVEEAKNNLGRTVDRYD